MSNIFSNISFMESSRGYRTTPNTINIPTNIIYNEGSLIKNCDCFVSENMILECGGSHDLIRQAAILEGAKLNLILQNFLDEGDDYKGLKRELKTIIKANDLSDKELQTSGRKFLHICKRIVQIVCDINGLIKVVNGAYIVTISLIAGSIPMLLGSILGFVIGFIINRLFRLLWDTLEFDKIKKDAITIVDDLRVAAKKSESDKIKNKLNSEADKLEEAIRKYSK